jgi:hypothetical protein
LSPMPLPARSRPGTSLCRGCHIREIVPDDFTDEGRSRAEASA